MTRPTSDRVREAVFAMLGDVEGACVLDLFAGTGALGIEALSRGARRAVFVERDADAARVLSANLTALGIAPETVEVRRVDALAAAAQRKRSPRDIRSGLHRPPVRAGATSTFGLGTTPVADRWGPELSAILPSLLSPGARVVVESDRRAPLELDVALERHRRYGDTSITIHRHQ